MMQDTVKITNYWLTDSTPPAFALNNPFFAFWGLNNDINTMISRLPRTLCLVTVQAIQFHHHLLKLRRRSIQ